MTMSVGIGSLSLNKPAGADELIAMADVALYQAKERGRDRIVATTEIACAVRVPAQPVAN